MQTKICVFLLFNFRSSSAAIAASTLGFLVLFSCIPPPRIFPCPLRYLTNRVPSLSQQSGSQGFFKRSRLRRLFLCFFFFAFVVSWRGGWFSCAGRLRGGRKTRRKEESADMFPCAMNDLGGKYVHESWGHEMRERTEEPNMPFIFPFLLPCHSTSLLRMEMENGTHEIPALFYFYCVFLFSLHVRSNVSLFLYCKRSLPN